MPVAIALMPAQGVEPETQLPEGTVIRQHRKPGEAERRHGESAALVAHGPPGGRTPTGSGSGGPVRPASARHCRTSCRPPSVENLNVIRPSRATHSSRTNGALHFAHRA